MQLATGFFWVSKGYSSFDFFEDPIALRASDLTLQLYLLISSCHVFSFLFRDSWWSCDLVASFLRFENSIVLNGNWFYSTKVFWVEITSYNYHS